MFFVIKIKNCEDCPFCIYDRDGDAYCEIERREKGSNGGDLQTYQNQWQFPETPPEFCKLWKQQIKIEKEGLWIQK